MLLKDAPFYPALCWAIKKYIPQTKLPDPSTEVNRDANNIDGMCCWIYTPDRHSYWRDLHDFFTEKYFIEDEDEGLNDYFSIIMIEHKKHMNPQLEFNFGGK